MSNSEKVRVSRRQLAQVLCFWLSQRLSKQAVEETAKDLGFPICTNEDFNKVFDEMFSLNMWLIVRACQKVFEDQDKRNDCLDIFHRVAYERYIQGTEEDFGEWIKSMGAKYIGYNTAMNMDHPVNRLWVLAKLINKNLFGEFKKDLFVQMGIGAYIGIPGKHLEELIKKYDVE
jgi:hypothetical protein